MITPASSSTPSPASVEPLHHPGHEAVVEPPVGIDPGAGEKALLAKKLAAQGQSFVSPTDAMVSPCTAKLHSAKRKHFTKGKPLSLSNAFAQAASNDQDNAEGSENVKPIHS